MTTHDIELPPLPSPLGIVNPDGTEGMMHYTTSDLQDYAKAYALAAIEADRKRRGEPVHLFRRRGQPSGDFVTCSLERYAELSAMQDKFDTMIAYTAPQPAEHRMGEPVPKGWKLVPETPTSKQIVHMACQIKGADADGWFRTDGDDWHQHVAAAERAYKWALSEAPQPAEPTDKDSLSVAAPVACFKCGHSKHGGECVNVAPQPAEPVKVPSNTDIDELSREWGLQSAAYPSKSMVRDFAHALLARYTTTKEQP